jgi:hypothetical protein
MTAKLITWDEVKAHQVKRGTPGRKYVYSFIHMGNNLVYIRSFTDCDRLNQEAFNYFLKVIDQRFMSVELYALIIDILQTSSLNLAMQIYTEHFKERMEFVMVELDK